MAPNSAALAVAKIYPEPERAQKITLDIGAGTGLLAEEVLASRPPPLQKISLYRESVGAKYISGEICRLLGCARNNQCLKEPCLLDINDFFLLVLLHPDTNFIPHLVHINYWLENLKRCTLISLLILFFLGGGGRGEIGVENIFFIHNVNERKESCNEVL